MLNAYTLKQRILNKINCITFFQISLVFGLEEDCWTLMTSFSLNLFQYHMPFGLNAQV